MRSPLLKRSVVALASIAIGSVALSAVPASAAAPAGVTREQVLAVAANARATSGDLSDPAMATLTSIASKVCKVTADETVANAQAVATNGGDDADGFLGGVLIFSTSSGRVCEFGAVAAVDPATTLKGTSTVSANITGFGNDSVTPVSYSAPLSGNVATTRSIDTIFFGSSTTDVKFSAAGAATKTTTAKVVTKKTKAQKKAAKKKYSKRLASAKKKYSKALAKAGSSKSKKAAAKKAYAKRKASAKRSYKKAIAGYKLVTKTENRPFSVSASRN